MNRLVVLLCLQSLLFNLSGQLLRQKQNHSEQFSLSETEEHTFRSSKTVTAVAITCECDELFKVFVGEQEHVVPKDHDAPTPTYFLSLPEPTQNLRVESGGTTDFEVFLIYSGEPPSTSSSTNRISGANDCFDPLNTVPQSEWRSGLPTPNYARSFHDVAHNIVHHSAGSNSSTDFVQVVRDIYIFHTEVNGWSDIGYNYLIAQDGTIFNGRDPGSGSQDAVRGAHFCGQNSGTLGICLLGNYETATPSSAAIASLQSMLTFQLLLQDNDPFASTQHPLGRLGSIVGHRDGCATLCPGENVYSLLNELRMGAAAEIAICDPPIPLSLEVDTPLVKVGVPVTFEALGSYEDFQWNLEGAFPTEPSGQQVTVSYGTPGTYDVQLIGIGSQSQDTLLLTSFIQASALNPQPVLFPNPLTRDRILSIDSVEELLGVTLHSVTGRVLLRGRSSSLDLSAVASGVYFLRLETLEGVVQHKLIVP